MVYISELVKMYDEAYSTMEKAGGTVRLADPIWVNKKGDETDKQNSFGSQATHLLT